MIPITFSKAWPRLLVCLHKYPYKPMKIIAKEERLVMESQDILKARKSFTPEEFNEACYVLYGSDAIHML